MRILFILIIFFLLHKTNCFNLFKPTKIKNKLFIKTQQILSNDKKLKKNSKFDIYIDNTKVFRGKILKEYDLVEEQEEDLVELVEEQEDDLEEDLVEEQEEDLAEQLEENQDLAEQLDNQVANCNEVVQNTDSLLKTIVDLPKNIAYITLLGILYLGVNAYIFGIQIRKKFNEKNNL
jgi:hypothetical protein